MESSKSLRKSEDNNSITTPGLFSTKTYSEEMLLHPILLLREGQSQWLT